MAAKDRQKEKTAGVMRKHPAFDEEIHSQGVDTYVMLSPTAYASHSTLLLNPPSPKDRLAISGALRALGNSGPLHYLVPAAITAARLYYLVAVLEGLVMPQVQVLLSLAQEQRCPASSEAQRNLSSALAFLAGPAATLMSSSPALLREITWASNEKIPQLRNSVAHFRFRLDEAVQAADDVPSIQALGRLKGLGLHSFGALAKLLRLPSFDAKRIPDYEKSSVHYEENLNKPLLPTSRRRSYQEVKMIVERAERFGMSLLFAFMDVGVVHQEEGRLQLGECVNCKLGLRWATPGASAVCPVCGAAGIVPAAHATTT